MSKIGTSLKRSVLRNRKLFQKFQESLTKSSERERVGGVWFSVEASDTQILYFMLWWGRVLF